jgi:hypothetical protein
MDILVYPILISALATLAVVEFRVLPGWFYALPFAKRKPFSCLICHRNNHPGMDLQMTTDQFIVAQKHRKYWDQYVASLTMRLPPDAVGELQAILTAHGRPPTNWWCADCVKSALQYIYLQADLFLEVNQNTINHSLNAPANPEQ